MTIEKLNEEMSKILPFTYSHFKNAQSLPFMVYLPTSETTFYADGKNYFKRINIDLEYYFKEKDFDKEEEIENTLNSLEITYEKSGDNWIKEENMYEIIYSIQI